MSKQCLDCGSTFGHYLGCVNGDALKSPKITVERQPVKSPLPELNKKPRRAVSLEISIEADTKEDAIAQLFDLCTQACAGELRDVAIVAGKSSSANVQLIARSHPSPEQYQKQLAEYNDPLRHSPEVKRK